MSCVGEDSSAPSLPLFLFIPSASLVYASCSLHHNKVPAISCPRLSWAAEHENCNGKHRSEYFLDLLVILKTPIFKHKYLCLVAKPNLNLLWGELWLVCSLKRTRVNSSYHLLWQPWWKTQERGKPDAGFHILIPYIKERVDQPWISIQTAHMLVVITSSLWVRDYCHLSESCTPVKWKGDVSTVLLYWILLCLFVCFVLTNSGYQRECEKMGQYFLKCVCVYAYVCWQLGYSSETSYRFLGPIQRL